MKIICNYINPIQFKIENKNFSIPKLILYDFKSILADGILGYEFFADKQIYINFGSRIIKVN
jgi:hypothetical protein